MKPDRNSYTTLDFENWHASGTLVLAPAFQRRQVWTSPKKSYLIDTILRDLPIPPIYLRVRQNQAKTKIIREVIDGQQRISSVLDYLADSFALSRSIEGPYAGKRFSTLTEGQQDQIRKYAFNCESFTGIGDEMVLEIFRRMNTHSVKLNQQELRNGRYFGAFKQAVYQLAKEQLGYWRRHRILTEQGIARMKDAELVGELLVAQLDGLQDKKKSLDDFYQRFDEAFPERGLHQKRFARVLDEIDRSVGDILPRLHWRTPPHFYTLFCVVYHRLYGLPGRDEAESGKRRFTRDDASGLSDAALELADVLARAKAGEPAPSTYATFVTASQRQTDNLKPRVARFKCLYEKAFRA